MHPDDLHRDPETLWAGLRRAAPDSARQPYPGEPDPGFPLDPFQAEAALHFRGPVRVLAPAGSGKTRTLTARIAALLSRGVPAERILALAFNARAAEEMSERLAGNGGEAVQTRTFHSLGYEIVRAAYGWAYAEANEAAFDRLAREVLTAHLPLPEHPGQARRFLENAANVLKQARSRLLPLSALTVQGEDGALDLSDAFRLLIDKQAELGLLTFADMIYFALRALVADAALRERWQRRFEFVLVDEFQDLDAAQMLLVRILALPEENLFAVGDDDQLIYAWRGAAERHILDFEAMYPGAGSVVLATNYRSGSRIIRHGRWLIENNPERVSKDIRPRRDAPPGTIAIVLAGRTAEQAEIAANWMLSAAGREARWEDFGLLARTNADLDVLADALTRHGIPFTLEKGTDAEETEAPDTVQPGRASLLTVHRSKGKEFSHVVYFNLSRRPSAGTSEADERRVAYVGVTRARAGLLLTADRERPSPFLREFALNPDFADFTAEYLGRKLGIARRRAAWRARDWKGWVRAWRPARLNEAPKNGYAQGEIERIETELQFRQALAVVMEP